MKRGYILRYEWGETWEVTDDNFDWDRDYWYSVIARNIQYYRDHTTNFVDIVTYCTIDRVTDGEEHYYGMISVGKISGYVILHTADGEINKEIAKETFE